MIFQLDTKEISFPDPSYAEDDGLLAVGGDLSAERLMLAYQHGIFPWFNAENPICWYAPHQRFVLYPDQLKITKSMQQLIRNSPFTVSHNQAFEKVIKACAEIHRPDQQGTWISEEMQAAYIKLHNLGYAHSIEVWKDQELVGGLYGVQVNQVFCGESMFSKLANTSKLALIYLTQAFNFRLIDCQIESAHLRSLGAIFISQEEFRTALKTSDVQL